MVLVEFGVEPPAAEADSPDAGRKVKLAAELEAAKAVLEKKKRS